MISRDLDIQAAEKVLGLTVFTDDEFNGVDYHWVETDWVDDPLPEFTRDMAAAWRLIDHIGKGTWELRKRFSALLQKIVTQEMQWVEGLVPHDAIWFCVEPYHIVAAAIAAVGTSAAIGAGEATHRAPGNLRN